MRILLVESDDLIANSLTTAFKAIRIDIDRAELSHLDDAPPWTGTAPSPYLAILLGDEEETALMVARARKNAPGLPILCFLDLRQSDKIVRLLDAGADDCLIRPVKAKEIAARIRAIRRRGTEQRDETFDLGPLTIFLDGRDPEVNGRPIKLSRREHSTFMALAHRQGRVISKETLFEAVYGLTGSQPFDKVIDVYICKLRRKLADATQGERFIETVVGRGYRLAHLGAVAERSRAVA